MRQWLLKRCSIVAGLVLVGSAGVATSVEANTPLVGQPMLITSQSDEPPETGGDGDPIEQDFTLFDAVVASPGNADRFKNRTVNFTLPAGCSGQNGATKYSCDGKEFSFTASAFADDGVEMVATGRISGTSIVVKAEFIPSGYISQDLTFTVYAVEAGVAGGITSGEISQSVIEMTKSDAGILTETELNAEEEELKDAFDEGDSGEVAARTGVSPYLSASRPSKVGIPSTYVWCSFYDRPRYKRCQPPRLHDYCSWSPDRPVVYAGRTSRTVDFRGPCARHDMGIAKILKQGGTVGTKRSKRRTADRVFRDRMYQNCSNAFYQSTSSGRALKSNCRSIASTYYRVVSGVTNRWSGKGA